MSEQIESTQSAPTSATTNFQATQQTGQTSELSKLSQGQEGSILSNASSVTTHSADPVSRTAPKQDENVKDAPIITGQSDEDEYDLELSKDSLLTEEDLNEIAEEAGRLNLSKKDAEKLLSMRESVYKKGMGKAQADYLAKVESAKKEITSHPDFIGDKKTKSFESISRVVNAFGDDKLVEALKSPEVGNNLAIALFLKRLGDAMSQDSFEGKGTSGAANVADNKEATLQSLYPDFFKK
jgi:hypothetical protein